MKPRFRLAVTFTLLLAPWACSMPASLETATPVDPETENRVALKVQGEYAGLGPSGDSLGLQVVAQGQGLYRAVILTGGLPGAGWDGKNRLESTASRSDADSEIVFKGFAGQTLRLDTAGLAATFAATGSGAPVPPMPASTLSKVMRTSPTLLQPAPTGARVLFDGRDIAAWKGATLTGDGLLSPQGGSGSTGAITDTVFGDFFLHLEFRTPFLPDATGQARGNSGIYLQNRYELQILDSFGVYPADSIEASRHCGAVWEQSRPLVNMSLPPLAWQTYDIDFRAARFASDGKTITQRAVVTVRHNGVMVQNAWTLPDRTVLGDFEGPLPGPHRLQWHGDAVVYRNVWVTSVTPLPTLPKKGRAWGGYPGNDAPKTTLPRVNSLGRLSLPAPGRSLRAQSHTAIFPTIH